MHSATGTTRYRRSTARTVAVLAASLAAALLAVLVSSVAPASALSPAQISGTVSDSVGTLLPGSIVSVLDVGTTVVEASTTANSSGFYSLTVPAGTYDLTVGGPAGSGLSAASFGKVLAAGSTTIDWVIGTAAQRVVTISGLFTLSHAQVQGTDISLSCSVTGQHYGGAFGGAGFSLSVVADPSCTLGIRAYTSDENRTWSVSGIHVDASIDRDLGSLDLSPTGQVRVTALNADGSPLAGAAVSISDDGSPIVPLAPGITGTATVSVSGPATKTDANGQVVFDTYDVGVTSASASASYNGYSASGTAAVSGALTDVALTFPAMPPPPTTVNVSGSVAGTDGGSVFLSCATTNKTYSADYGPLGFSLLVVADPSCSMTLRAFSGEQYSVTLSIAQLDASTDVALGALQINPTAQVRVTALNADGTPLPGAQLNVATSGGGTVPVAPGVNATVSVTQPSQVTGYDGVALVPVYVANATSFSVLAKYNGFQASAVVPATGVLTDATVNFPAFPPPPTMVTVSGNLWIDAAGGDGGQYYMSCATTGMNYGGAFGAGGFTFQVQADPSCTLNVSGGAGELYSFSLTGIHIDASTDVSLGTLVLRSLAHVHVTALNADGSPDQGARLSVAVAGGAPVEVAPGVVGTASVTAPAPVTDANGDATYDVYVGGVTSYSVSLSQLGYPTTTRNLPVTLPTTDATVYMVGSGVWVPGTPAQQADGDNVSPLIEAQVPSRSAAPGDGNGDGTTDALQPNVTSLPVLGGTPASQPYVTVAAPAGSSLTNVFTVDPSNTAQVPSPPPPAVTLPEGLTHFVLAGIAPGSTQTLSIYTVSTAGVTGYAKYNPATGVWTQLPASQVSIFADHVDIRLVDGGVGDDDGLANGQIDDPGGLAIVTDKTPPVVKLTGPKEGVKYVLGDTPTASCKASDADSGLAGPCTVAVNGGNANKVGAFTATARATDKAGNTTTVIVHYKVVYGFAGFDQPINDPNRAAKQPLSVFKAGSTVTAQFVLTDSRGRSVQPLSAPLWVTPVAGRALSSAVNEAVSTAVGDTRATYAKVGSSWRYLWRTTKPQGGRLWTLAVTLDDGETHTVTVGVN